MSAGEHMRSGIKRSAAGVLRKRIPEITAARGTAEAPASGAPEDSGLFRGSENCGGQVSFGRQGTVPMPFGLFGIHKKPAALGSAGMGQVNAAPGTAAGKGCRRLRAGKIAEDRQRWMSGGDAFAFGAASKYAEAPTRL